MTPRTADPRSFRNLLLVLVGVGLAARLAYALIVMHGVAVGGDGLEFHTLAQQLAQGEGYVEPLFLAPSHLATADKPPLYPLVLAGPAWLGAGSVAWNRVVSCLMGAALVAALGLLGRRVAGCAAGLCAAAIGALYPVLVSLDGSVRGESLYAPLIAVILLAAYRYRDAPSTRRAVELGLLVGLATLTRSEAVVLLVLAPLAAGRRRLRGLGIATIACLVVLSPWIARNWSVFGRPLLSTNSGSLLYGANCHDAYYTAAIGTWACYPTLRAGPSFDEAQLASRLSTEGLHYAEHHLGRIPPVAAVRLLRTWGVWNPASSGRLEAVTDDVDLAVERAGQVAYYLLVPLALAGALVLRRRREPLAILLAPVVLVSLLSVVAYGTSRFRVAAEIPVVVLAAVAVAQWAVRTWGPA